MAHDQMYFFEGWSAERHKIYERAVSMLRHRISLGKTYYQALDSLSDLDYEMRSFLEKDFLKILIAEEHFGSNIPLDDLALFLGLSFEEVIACRDTLLREMNREFFLHSGVDSLAIQ